MPLCLQCFLVPMNLLQSPLFEIYVRKMDIKRPFPVENPFGDIGEQFEKIKEEKAKLDKAAAGEEEEKEGGEKEKELEDKAEAKKDK